MSTFQPGDHVEVVPGRISREVENMISGKIGVVVPNFGPVWDVTVKFEGTQRPGGWFGFYHTQVRKVES